MMSFGMGISIIIIKLFTVYVMLQGSCLKTSKAWQVKYFPRTRDCDERNQKNAELFLGSGNEISYKFTETKIIKMSF